MRTEEYALNEDRQCSKCSIFQPAREFPKNGKCNGVQRYRSSCKACEVVRVTDYLSDPDYRDRMSTWVLGNQRKRKNIDPLGLQAYKRAHGKVRGRRGPAKEFLCIDCGEQAKEWSLRRSAIGSVRSELHSWSDDINDYEPRCVPCHRALDKEVRNSRAA